MFLASSMIHNGQSKQEDTQTNDQFFRYLLQTSSSFWISKWPINYWFIVLSKEEIDGYKQVSFVYQFCIHVYFEIKCGSVSYRLIEIANLIFLRIGAKWIDFRFVASLDVFTHAIVDIVGHVVYLFWVLGTLWFVFLGW